MTRTPTRVGDDLAVRWERQQERYLPRREERFGIMLDVVARQTDDSDLRLLDLCCGTGLSSRRVLACFRSASILAVDMDPAHLELGRRALGDRVEWRDADLRNQGWAYDLPTASFHAVLSATATIPEPEQVRDSAHRVDQEAALDVRRHLARRCGERPL